MNQAVIDRPTLNPALRDFWLAPARNKILHGGRASTKSWDAAGFATYLADNARLRILCVRQFQNRISESVYALLKTQIFRFGLNHRFKIEKSKIYNRYTGTEFMFYGLWKSIDEIKSFEGVDILWIEEAHNLTEEQWKILEPTIRKAFSQVWIIFNPKLVTDYVWKRFVVNPPPDTIVRQINYTENPFLSQTMLKIINAAKEEDADDFAHVYLGQPLQNDDDSIIKRSWIMAAIDANKTLGITPSGSKRLGFDIADGGPDKCAWASAHGFHVNGLDLWKAGEDELLKSCTRTYNEARKRGAHINYDSIGVGAMAGAKFAELNKANPGANVSYAKFNAGGAVYRPEALYSNQTKNKDMFANIKAQAWWGVGDRFRNVYNAVKNGHQFKDDDIISISGDLPFLELMIDELATPKRDVDKNGRMMVESKKDLAKRDIPSPNIADAVIMDFVPGLMPIKISASAMEKVAS